MKILIFDETDGYGGGYWEPIAVSHDEAKLLAKQAELLELSKAVDKANAEHQEAVEKWKAECQEATRQFLDRNRDAMRDPSLWSMTFGHLKSWLDKPVTAKQIRKLQDNVIAEICHIRWLSFVGGHMKAISEYLDLEKLPEPVLSLPHMPPAPQEKTYSSGSFYIATADEL